MQIAKLLRVLTVLLLVLAIPAAGVFAGGAAEEEEEVVDPLAALDELDTADGPFHLPDRTVTTFNEAPMLAEMVDAGNLPPVEERLPANPVVVEPYEYIGEYGGELRTHYVDWTAYEGWINEFGYVNLVKQVQGYTGEYESDIAESWEASADRTEWTFTLREGIKWSDGEPFTTEDIRYWYEDVRLNATLDVPPPSLTVAGEPAELIVHDERTFTFRFAEPYGLLLLEMTGRQGQMDFDHHPKHYFSQFHEDYADPADLQRRIDEADVEDWAMLYEAKLGYLQEPDAPRLSAWEPVAPATDEGRQRWQRNPYYYKVDSAGNQLPYIDEIVFDQYPDLEVLMLALAGGEQDYANIRLRSHHWPVLAENAEQGDYRLVPSQNAKPGQYSLFFNFTTPDDQLREIFNDVRFRKAVSYAHNREEVVDIDFGGLAEPGQASPPPMDPAYHEEWANAYIEYDPDRANELLDEMGLDERDADGYRLLPDGRRFTILFDNLSGSHDDANELTVEYMADIGIEVDLRPAGWGLYIERAESNDVQMHAWSQQMGLNQPREFTPHPPWRSWGVEWYHWRESGGEAGEEPPEWVKRLYEIWDEAGEARDEEHRIELLLEAGDIHMEYLPTIGIAGMDPRPAAVHNRVRNIMDKEENAPPWGVNLDPHGGTSYPESWFVIPGYEY